MISASSSLPVLQFPLNFSGESFMPPMSNVKFRQAKSAVVSAAYASPAAERETTTSSSSTCVFPPKLATSFYEVLGIPMGATNDEIKAAYRRLARICHPDVAAVDRKKSSADEFMKIRAAYSTLSDPEKRADYDRGLLRRPSGAGLYSTASPSVSRFYGYSGRNWETDQCW